VVLLLLQYGASPIVQNHKELTAVDLARKKGYQACVKILQDYHLHHAANFDSILFLASVEVLSYNFVCSHQVVG
jgi:hypothetical protein